MEQIMPLKPLIPLPRPFKQLHIGFGAPIDTATLLSKVEHLSVVEQRIQVSQHIRESLEQLGEKMKELKREGSSELVKWP
jgi:hypothetical protein